MKTLVLITALLFTGLSCFAQQIDDKALFLKKSQKYKRMRNTGVALTIGGTILSVVGAASLVNSSTTTNNGTTQSNVGSAVGGLVTYIAGIGCVGAGVPLWIVGGINHGRYQRKYEGLSAQLKVGPQMAGVKLTFRF